MPLSPIEHLDNLIRHIDLVRNACILLGKRIMAQGRSGFGRMLIARGFEHDVSKFYGIEWDFLHAGKDIPKEKLDMAIRHHVLSNSHHPEHHEGIQNMGELDLAEMVCDWFARSQEFGTGLRDWIKQQACPKFKLDPDSIQYKWVNNFVDILLEDSFVRA